jgi:hypothetical protein
MRLIKVSGVEIEWFGQNQVSRFMFIILIRHYSYNNTANKNLHKDRFLQSSVIYYLLKT